jgi:hypothetical protein
MRPKTFTVDPRSNLDKFVDGLDNLPLHAFAAQIEMESAPGSTSSGVATTSPGLDLFQFRDLHSRSQLGSCKPATDLQEANISRSLSMLEEDLDFLLPLWLYCALEGHDALRSTRGRGSTCGSPRALAFSKSQAIGYRGGGVD